MKKATQPRAAAHRRAPLLIAALAVAVLVVGTLVWRPWSARASGDPLAGTRPASAVEIEERYGVQVTLVAVTAAGGLIDFRFRVTDPARASALLDPESLPVLVAEDGTALRTSRPPEVDALEAGRVYFILYPNSGTALRRGDPVTVVFGELRLESQTVQ